MTTSPQTLFQTNSYWTPNSDLAQPEVLPISKTSKSPEETLDLIKDHLEDWSQRIQSCADEAQDEHLLVLHSDLLDLRDEITYALHESLLS